ncbi:TPA: hypothetical protein R1934_001957 [Staphylococcus delphini]|nr:hypothetical protein [Staphylococcus delphini]HEC2205463.1 hypothetical protein [Staphylococcus delphini]
MVHQTQNLPLYATVINVKMPKWMGIFRVIEKPPMLLLIQQYHEVLAS